jgi:phosphomannomutase
MSQAPLMLTVSGLRGLIGSSLTPPVASRYAAAFGQWLKAQKCGKAGSGSAAPMPHVVLGRDSRPSGQMIELAAAAGLIAAGCKVTTLGIVSTPGVAIMTEHLQADGGMVVTASHNPVIWNGIKALRHDGVAPPPDQAAQIISCFEQDRMEYAPVEALAALEHNDATHRIHVERVLAQVDVPAIRRRRPKVVLDSVHGAGGPATAMLLGALGAEVTHLFAEPTGRFPHPPEPTREHLTGLCDAVRAHHADIGFAQDPDADRLAIVDEQGQYLGEEYTLALACWHVLERVTRCYSKSAGKSAPLAIAANLSTSRMIDDIALRFGARSIRTPVGEANVAAAIRANNAVIGGEGNGGVIFPPVVHVRDSLIGIALVLELLAGSAMPLSRIAGQIPRYAIVKDKINLTPELARELTHRLTDKFQGQRIDLQDGVRIDWPDRWVHARVSNTEPIVRIIAEAPDEAQARQAIAQVRSAMGA